MLPNAARNEAMQRWAESQSLDYHDIEPPDRTSPLPLVSGGTSLYNVITGIEEGRPFLCFDVYRSGAHVPAERRVGHVRDGTAGARGEGAPVRG